MRVEQRYAIQTAQSSEIVSFKIKFKQTNDLTQNYYKIPPRKLVLAKRVVEAMTALAKAIAPASGPRLVVGFDGGIELDRFRIRVVARIMFPNRPVALWYQISHCVLVPIRKINVATKQNFSLVVVLLAEAAALVFVCQISLKLLLYPVLNCESWWAVGRPTRLHSFTVAPSIYVMNLCGFTQLVRFLSSQL